MTGFQKASVSIYRVLTGLYPYRFRAAFQDQMVLEFGDSMGESLREHGWKGGAREWIRTLIDLGSTLLREYVIAAGSRQDAGRPELGGPGLGPQRMRGEERMASALREIRFAVRRIVRVPGYTLAFVVTLGLGIGANTAIFSLINGVLLKPLPHENGDELVYLRQSAQLSGQANVLFSVPEIVDFRERTTSLAGVAEHSTLTFTLLGLEQPRRVRSGIVTGNYFSLMGLQAVLGRTLDDRDDGETAAPAMMLTYDFWGRVFGFDPAVIGRTYQMNGRSIEIIGVLEPAPPYPERTDVFVNMVSSPHHLGASMNHDRLHRMTEVFARLAPGATIETARTEVSELATIMRSEYPESYDETAGYEVSVTGLQDQLTRRARPTLWILLGTAAFVLIIACANVANLTLARVVKRERELAIRASLGATKGTLRRALLIENLLLSTVGAALGVAVALGGLDALVAFTARFTIRASEITLDGSVFLFAMAIATAAALLFAWLPRIPAPGGGARTPLRTSNRATDGAARRRVQRGLVVAQVAVSFVLLVGAGLLMRTFLALQTVDAGFETENVLTLEIPTIMNNREPDEERTYYETILRRVQALPGVREAALGTIVPLRSVPSAFFSLMELKIEGQVVPSGEPTPRADFRPVSPEYFRTLGVDLLAGRMFEATDGPENRKVVIVNEALADRFFPNEDPIGKRLAWSDDRIRFFGLSGDWRTIVGVVGDSKDYGLDHDVFDAVFHPYAQDPFVSALFVRVTGDAERMARPVTEVIHTLDPNQPIENVLTLEAIRSESLAPRRLNATLIGGFALLAMVIAAVGVFSVLAFSVSQRTREFGVRTALGAKELDVVSTVLREGLILTGIGLALGAAAAAGLSRFLTSFLFGVSAGDPTTFLLVASALVTVAAAASWLPARRAARVDPVEALRAD